MTARPRPPARWTTRRLTLRPPRRADAREVFAAYAQDPEVTRYLLFRPHRHVRETIDFVRRCRAGWETDGPFTWALLERRSGRLAGMCMIRVQGHAVELAYALARPYWGRRLMAEAMKPIVAWALARPEIQRVWATCHVRNTASARVMERLGMKREGILRKWAVYPNLGDVAQDSSCYSRVKGTRGA
ncbi:MAG: GNAT family N-acetyltransferase [Acidobacteria bacterium]|nr:GNAT family N-acetyltransferase [Acidobacteriota bacterium]